MAKIYSNQELSLDTEGEIWEASNGATRRTLILINKTNQAPAKAFRAALGKLDKGNHSFIFLNEEKNNDERVFGLFLNNAYGYQLVEGTEVYTNCSVGGYGNSCSQFGIYEMGAVLEVNTYKNRNTPTYYKLTEQGWNEIPSYQLSKIDEI